MGAATRAMAMELRCAELRCDAIHGRATKAVYGPSYRVMPHVHIVFLALLRLFEVDREDGHYTTSLDEPLSQPVFDLMMDCYTRESHVQTALPLQSSRDGSAY